MRKGLWMIVVLVASLLMMVGCAGNEEQGGAEENQPAEQEEQAEAVTIKVGATPVPHAEILEQVKPILAAQGITLEVVEFTDYVLPNQSLNDGELDANFFQHVPYMESFNEEHGTNIKALLPIHFEPIGLYGGKSKSLDNMPEGATFAVPNDPTNEARALQLLADQGLIKLKEGVGLDATPIDITENPKKIVVKEFDAAMLPRLLGEVDYAIINGNYAIDAGLSLSDALVAEGKESLAAETFANVVAVRADENREVLNQLGEAMKSEEVKKFIEDKYQGSVVPLF